MNRIKQKLQEDKKILSIYFSAGYPNLDDTVQIIQDLEKNIYEEVKSSNPEIIDSINNTGKLDEKIEKQLTSVIEKFKKKKSK